MKDQAKQAYREMSNYTLKALDNAVKEIRDAMHKEESASVIDLFSERLTEIQISRKIIAKDKEDWELGGDDE